MAYSVYLDQSVNTTYHLRGRGKFFCPGEHINKSFIRRFGQDQKGRRQ